MRWLLSVLVLVVVVPAAAAADWTDRRDTVWQDGDTIHARGRGKTEPDAVERARMALTTAVRSSLPDLDPDLVARSAVIGERATVDEYKYVRLDFHAANGKACLRPRNWFDTGIQARADGAANRAVAAFAQAAWRDPQEVDILDSLALQLADLGLWGSSAMLYDAAAAAFDEPPLSLMRSRITVHLWMGDKAGATEAIEVLRAFDPIDQELRTLESLVFSMRPRPLQLVEQEVMPIFAETYDAELAVRFAVWEMLDADTRAALIHRDIDGGEAPDTVTLGGIRFKDLRGDVVDDDTFQVENREGGAWTVTVTPGQEGVSCLAQASRFDPPDSLPRERLLVGALYPLRDPQGGARLDEGWLIPTYYADQDTGEERVYLRMLLRWGDRTANVSVDGAIGEDRLGRPGMLNCPELVQMILAGAYPKKGETS